MVRERVMGWEMEEVEVRVREEVWEKGRVLEEGLTRRGSGCWVSRRGGHPAIKGNQEATNQAVLHGN
jgi:hypothetical protein